MHAVCCYRLLPQRERARQGARGDDSCVSRKIRYLGVQSTAETSLGCSILAYNIAAEVAGQRDDVRGPNTFRGALIDECYNLKPEQIGKAARLALL